VISDREPERRVDARECGSRKLKTTPIARVRKISSMDHKIELPGIQRLNEYVSDSLALRHHLAVPEGSVLGLTPNLKMSVSD
jgi:hypothetical protein